MDRNQKIATFIFIFIAVIALFINYATQVSQAVPNQVEDIYSQVSEDRLSSGRLRVYISEENPLRTSDRLIRKLGRPYEMTDLNKWRAEPNRPIILLYDDYAVTIREIDRERSQIEVTNYETAYDRHRSSFIYFWGPSVRRGSIFKRSTGRVRGGGFGFGK